MKAGTGWRLLEFAIALGILALVIALAWAFTSPAFAADAENSKSVTGIPIDYLFACIAGLITIVYTDIRRAIFALKHEAARRGRHMRHVENAVRLMCHKLHIPYEDTDDE